MLTEQELSQASPARIRLKESEYLYRQFLSYCGPPVNSYFPMNVYLDAFLFCSVSIEEMVPKDLGEKLNSTDVFKFLKAARNATTHHSPLAAPAGAQTLGFLRPFNRHVSESVGKGPSSSRLCLNVKAFEEVFELAAAKYRKGSKTLQAGKNYLSRLDSEKENVFIEGIMRDALKTIQKIITEKV